ncbi:hypothetical protein MMC14_004071 [Varicellaria rhodocarpa]|nr:hypothetical protein [Varicellaria rhodocarpa]
MRFSLLLRSLPFLPAPYGEVHPQPEYVGYDLPRPRFVRTITVLTFVTPSPSASPIPISSQSQTVTSYIPELTVCPVSSNTGSPVVKRQPLPTAPTFQFPNVSTTAELTPSCTVRYSPTITPICYITLTPLGGIPIIVSDCTQSIAFKTDYGFYMPANATAILVPTTYLAPWNSLISGVPKGLIQASICPSSLPCLTLTETWFTEVFEAATTSISTININTVITGPHEILIPPSIILTIAGPTPSTISMSTTVAVPSAFASTIIIQDTLYSGAPTTTYSSDEPKYTTVYATSTSTRYITLAMTETGAAH